MSPAPSPSSTKSPRSGFLMGLGACVLVGSTLLAAYVGVRWPGGPAGAASPSATADLAAATPVPASAGWTAPPSGSTAALTPRAASNRVVPAYDNIDLSPQARHTARWVVYSGNAAPHAFFIVDKQQAQVHAFDPNGGWLASAPALLGAAQGDDSAPGIGEKPLAQIQPEEKTTPAGRFVAQAGFNTHGEDIVWVDYDAAVSMHRVRPLVAAERRLERLASPTAADNRISFGCINLPVAFYEQVISPTVQRDGAVIYVLPESRTPQAMFGSYDVPAPAGVLPAQPRVAPGV